MKKVLRPFSHAYGGVVRLRNTLFDKGVFKQKHFNVPIISVGNISVGGTGKTPVVAHFVNYFLKAGKKVCIVTRGYGGSYKEEAVSVNAQQAGAAGIYGDEPVWFAKSLNVPVYVGRERSKAVELCLSEQNADVILADDGFQHRWLGRDRDLVLLDAMEDSPALLPAGRFREPMSSLKRADYVFLTKSNLAGEAKSEYWRSVAREQGFSENNNNFFVIDYRLADFKSIGHSKILADQTQVLLASAIARPLSFEQLFSRQVRILKHFIHTDHHAWTQEDVDAIKKSADSMSCHALVVTEKDFVKISDLNYAGLELYVATLEITFTPAFPYEELLK